MNNKQMDTTMILYLFLVGVAALLTSLFSYLMAQYYYTNVNNDYEMGKRKEYSTVSVVSVGIVHLRYSSRL